VPRLTEENLEELRSLTVRLLLDLRADYLRTPGASILSHWDQLTSRMQRCARTSVSPAEWVTAMLRSLRIASPSQYTSATAHRLAQRVADMKAAREWLDLVTREHGYLIAEARVVVDERRAARDARVAECREEERIAREDAEKQELL
jgi:ribosomal protein L34E